MPTSNSKAPMLVQDLYYRRWRIQRIYQNGELVWFAGDILPLSDYSFVDSVVTRQGVPMALPIALIKNVSNIYVHCSNDMMIATDAKAVIAYALRSSILTTHSFAKLTEVTARYSWHGLNRHVHLDRYGRFTVAQAKIGNHGLDILVSIDPFAAGFAVTAASGNHLMHHDVVWQRVAYANIGTAETGNHMLHNDVMVEIFSTAGNPVARSASHSLSNEVTTDEFLAFHYGKAVPGHHQMHNDVEVSHYKVNTIAVRSWGRLIDHWTEHTVAVGEFGYGEALESKFLNHATHHQITASCFNGDIVPSDVRIGNVESDIEVVTSNSLRLTPVGAVPLDRMFDHLVTRTDDLNGSIARVVSGRRNVIGWMTDTVDGGVSTPDSARLNRFVASWMVDDVDGHITTPKVALVKHYANMQLIDTVEGAIDIADVSNSGHGSIIFMGDPNAEYAANSIPAPNSSHEWSSHLDITAESALAEGITIASLSASHSITCNVSTEAYLSGSWEYPIQNGTDLYIRQTYNTTRDGAELIIE